MAKLKLPQVASRRARAKLRLESMNTKSRKALRRKVRKATLKEAGRYAGRRLLKDFGFDRDHFKKGGLIRGKLGLFGESLSKNTRSNSDNISIPNLRDPEEVSRVSNPDITSIISQLEDLYKTTKKLGITTKAQQESILKQIKEAKRVSKENQIESNAVAALEPPAMSGVGITPLDSIVDDLIKSINKLNEVVDEKIEEQEDEGDAAPTFLGQVGENLGLLDPNDRAARAAARREPKLRRGYGWDDKSGRYYKKMGRGRRSFVKEEEALRNAKKADLLTKSAQARRAASEANKITKAGRVVQAVKVAGTAASATKIGATIAKSFSRTRAVGKAAAGLSEAAIKKIAGPLIAKSLGRAAARSIPIIGTVAGLGFAAMRLAEGDVVGAGLDVASAAPFVGIPALIASIARDAYMSVFGMAPEKDPAAGSKLKIITDIVSAMVQQQIRGILKPEKAESPTEKPPVMPAAPPKPQAQQTSSPPPTSAPPKPQAQSSSSNGGNVSSTNYDGPQSAPAQSPAQAAQKEESATAQMSPPTPSTGSDITNASLQNEINRDMPSLNPMVSGDPVPLPTFVPTTKNGAVGMGNVPSVIYPIPEAMLPQLYFLGG